MAQSIKGLTQVQSPVPMFKKRSRVGAEIEGSLALVGQPI